MLVHAAGFCATALWPMAQDAVQSLHGGAALGVDLRGHGLSSAPPGETWSWDHFALDVLNALDALSVDRPIGFGHSLGGAALLLAEAMRPGTFGALYCYEPVVLLSGDPAPLARSMAEAARRRRRRFPSRDDARQAFGEKPPMDRFDDGSLRGYLEGGLIAEAGGVRLACDAEHEARIYEAVPSSTAWEGLGSIRCPVMLACGSAPGPTDGRAMATVAERIPTATVEVMEGLGHFGPMERPKEVSASFCHFVRRNLPSG